MDKSNFFERLKTFKTKEEKRYAGNELHYRIDNETKKIGVYVVKKILPKIQSSKPWTISKYKMRDINVKDFKNIIDYVLTVSPSGHFCTRKYFNAEDEEKYGEMYSSISIGLQLFGNENFTNRTYTLSQLIELADEINKRKESAIYDRVVQINYNDLYKGKKYLDNFHILMKTKCEENSERNIVCLEDKSIKVKFVNENLVVIKDGEKVITRPENFKMIDTINMYDYHFPPRYLPFAGFTPEAFEKLVKEKKQEKESEEKDEIRV